MTRILYEAASLLFLGMALYDAGFAVHARRPVGVALFAAPCLIYGVITLSQQLPIAIAQSHRECYRRERTSYRAGGARFPGLVKSVHDGLIVWVNQFVVCRGSTPLFFFGEGASIVVIFASVFAFRAKLNKLA